MPDGPIDDRDDYSTEIVDRKDLPEDVERALALLDEPDPWMWWYKTVTLTVLLVMFMIGIGFIVGPQRWSEGNSISIIHHHAQWLPVQAFGVPFIVASLSLAWEKTRLWAYMVALFFSSFFAVSSIFFALFNSTAPPSAVPDYVQAKQTDTIVIPLHTNVVTLGLSLLGLLLILAGMRYVVDDRNKREIIANAEKALEDL